MKPSFSAHPPTFKLGHTLQVRAPLGLTLGLALLILFGLVGLAEVFTHTPAAQTLFPVPSLGTNFHEFELKEAALEARARQAGRIDCILIGNSVAKDAFNVQVLEDIYQQELGQPIQCFDFTLTGVRPQSIGPLVQYLTTTFQPQLIIYGVNDWYINLSYDHNYDPIVDTPWFQYQLGHPSWLGWLSVNSGVYRNYPRLINLYTRTDKTVLEPLNLEGGPALLDDVMGPVVGDVTHLPIRAVEAPWYYALSHYQIPPQAWQSFEQIAAVKTAQVLIVEIPTHPTYADYYVEGVAGKQAALSQLRSFFQSRGVLYWTGDLQPTLPPDASYWRDRVHLHLLGANLWSTWLGNQLVQAVKTNVIRITAP